MTKQAKPKVAVDEATCPVAPLAREFARIIRARRALSDDEGGKRLIEATVKDENAGGLSPDYADKLLLRRYDAVQSQARQLCASSRIGLAFQMLLAHVDHLGGEFPGDVWNRVPLQVRDLSDRLEMERQGIIWTAYKVLTVGMTDPDLADLESMLGRETFTDAECTERVLRAVA